MMIMISDVELFVSLLPFAVDQSEYIYLIALMPVICHLGHCKALL